MSPRVHRVVAARAIAEAQESIERWLVRVLPDPVLPPTGLHHAMHHAVFPGGKRARPLLVKLVAATYGAAEHELVSRMACAVELVHCASLVHDDLPAFDDAALRRGKPTCHAKFGQATAILVGDALLTLAFETLGGAPAALAAPALRLVRMLAEATSSKSGIIGGQGLEMQACVDVDAYHLQKTSALFRAAAAGGAVAAGGESDVMRWARFGELVGRALQLRDDLDDVTGNEAETGKTGNRDAQLGRPNAVAVSGETMVKRFLKDVVEEATALIGDVTDATLPLVVLIAKVSGRG